MFGGQNIGTMAPLIPRLAPFKPRKLAPLETAASTTGGIMCDGRIGACPELADCFIQGNILNNRFSEVWKSKYQIFRNRDWTKKTCCKGCNVFPASFCFILFTVKSFLWILFSKVQSGGQIFSSVLASIGIPYRRIPIASLLLRFSFAFHVEFHRKLESHHCED